MNHALGVYYAIEHSRQSDRDYIAALQPPVIRLLDPDVQNIADAHRLAPNAIIAPRTWVIDDNNGDAVRRFMSDPKATGLDHAQQYRGQWDRWQEEARQRGLTLPPIERILFNATNEPNQGGSPERIAEYNIVFLNRCTELGIRAAALCLGVGWPDNTGPDTPVNWSPYAGIVEPIKRGKHCLELHEYNYKTGPQDGWRWLAGRHLQCPFDVPILLGEIGIDNYVDAARWEREGGNRGWQGNVSPDQYAAMVEEHIRGSDKRVFAALLYITDYRDNRWASFDTESAHGALLARKDRMMPQTTMTHIPTVSTGPTPAPIVTAISKEIITRVGANIRRGPSLDAGVLEVVNAGTRLYAVGETSEFYQVQRSGGVAYIHKTVANPVTEPAPQPTDNWQRSIAFVSRWEGGYQNVYNDRGNWTGGEVGKGELKGTNFGISAASYPDLDIKNLTQQEAHEIYRRDYWEKSGANQLAWPYCLIVFDTAVLHGVGAAHKWQAEVGQNAYAFAAKRLRSYTMLSNWDFWGKAWVQRVADLLDEAST